MQSLSNVTTPQDDTRNLKSMEEAIKLGEFQELSEEVVAAKCTQTCAVQTKLWTDAPVNEKASAAEQPTENQVDQKPTVTGLSPSSPQQKPHINKIKTPKRKLGRPRKISNSPVVPALSVEVSGLSHNGSVKIEPVVTMTCDSAVKQEGPGSECSDYIKPEPMEVEEKHSVSGSCTSTAAQPPVTSSSGSSDAKNPANGQNVNIDIDNIGNLESLFVMLHKDSEDDTENIDVNSFLANL